MGNAGQIPVFGEQLPGVHYQDRPGAYGILRSPSGELAIMQTGMGLFLPGGGLEPGEDELGGLTREIMEEIGHAVTRADFLGKAIQYHWSEFYQCHFRKIGSFYRVSTQVRSGLLAPEHELLWLPRKEAATRLTQAFQRWAIEQFS